MKPILKYLLAAAVFTGVAVSDSTSFSIYVVGDSTVQTYKDNVYPQTGWGQVLGYFFDASRVKVNNYAIGGRSSRTFIEEGRLDEVKGKLQKGDYLFVQFGHNDRDYSKAARYVEPSQFSGYIQKYVDAGKAKGANVILVSPMNLNGSRNVFSTGSNNYDARGMMQTVAKNNKIPFVDLNMKSYNTYNNTYKGMADYVTRYLYKKLEKGEYPNFPDGVNDGTTHFQEMGSMGHAQMICEELADNLKSNTNLSAEAKTALTTLVSAIKKRYTIKVKTNLSNYNGLITQTQYFPAGSPMTLRVTPNGQTFEKWVDDDCNELSKDMIYYGFKTKARDITYTAMFKGGAACTPISHASEDSYEEGPGGGSSSSSGEVEVKELDEALCSLDAGTDAWPSVIDMAEPEFGDGWTEKNHESYTGGGFFNLDNSAYSKATYMVTSDQSAEHARVMIRYSFAGNANRDMKVTVDNGTYDVVFPPTGSWDKWDTVYIDNVWVDALDFKVVLQSATADGGPNVDMIAFDMKDVYRTGCKAVREKQQGPVSVASKKIVTKPRASGITVNALGQKVQNVRDQSDLRNLPKGNYFRY
ncbi:GDSL-type esterase/lipase family protein [Fibrobacter sp. UWB11]|uniref:GDSL-type esterase/lipase family protein n=1 Tax=Fibrobacter sp. UWB11 TaxID=1896202 RepID=UPI000929F75D|nr:GDSL-type esterase/lipase family protein [Fibrobacter sp. UWB11]SIO11919.1 Lysophospholipase L1 [Fibrobacter sp. UWB11]